MTVRELINLLEDFDETAEVRIAHQPRWPFEYSIGDVVACDAVGDDEDDEDDSAEAAAADDAPQVVYIGEGEQHGTILIRGSHASRFTT